MQEIVGKYDIDSSYAITDEATSKTIIGTFAFPRLLPLAHPLLHRPRPRTSPTPISFSAFASEHSPLAKTAPRSRSRSLCPTLPGREFQVEDGRDAQMVAEAGGVGVCVREGDQARVGGSLAEDKGRVYGWMDGSEESW